MLKRDLSQCLQENWTPVVSLQQAIHAHEVNWMSSVRRREGSDSTVRIEIVPVVAAGSARKDRCTLTMLTGPTPGAVYATEANPSFIGRDSDCAIRISDGALSRIHARITSKDHVFWLSDEGSTNGTFLNGVRLESAVQLKSGDRIQLGGETVLKVAIHDAEEQETSFRLYEAAVRDPLTMLYNRRYLEERLESEYAFAARHTTPLSVLIFDIDYFKKINDSLGHPAGDVVLREVAQGVDRMLRKEDLTCRYGGEEFVIVARGIDSHASTTVGERVRHKVEQLDIRWESQPVPVTVSIGVATMDTAHSFATSSALLAAADRALYHSKNNGRNRVTHITYL